MCRELHPTPCLYPYILNILHLCSLHRRYEWGCSFLWPYYLNSVYVVIQSAAEKERTEKGKEVIALTAAMATLQGKADSMEKSAKNHRNNIAELEVSSCLFISCLEVTFAHCKKLRNSSQPCHEAIHLKALANYTFKWVQPYGGGGLSKNSFDVSGFITDPIIGTWTEVDPLIWSVSMTALRYSAFLLLNLTGILPVGYNGKVTTWTSLAVKCLHRF